MRARSGPARRAEWVAKLLDDAVKIPVIGIKIGLDPILSALPIWGDVIAAILGYYIVFEGVLARVPWHVLLLMFTLATIDVATGFIPVVGPVVDTFWKANRWNVDLIKRFG